MIHALLQARMSSSRLPGKVLKPLAGVPSLVRQIERIERARTISQLTVVTSTDVSDDPLAEVCRANGTAVYRGSLNDVLDRFYQAALPQKSQHLARLTGDCPLADPDVIDRVARFYLEGDYDYASNAVEPTFPDGLDVECFKFSSLETAWREAELPSEREHVTPFFYKHPEHFKVGAYKNETDLSALRWTLDEAADYEVIKAIYEGLYPKNPNFTMGDILEFLNAHPDVTALNSRFKRNEGLQTSSQNDLDFQKKKGAANV
jgi:spore coat polysaccharide biosynthesis protein SpsF